MEANKMKNMIVLKNLPSNIGDEAFVILKPNSKIKVEDYAEKCTNDKEVTTKFGAKDYMIKEAEMIISNYLSDIENEKRLKSMRIDKIELKYKRLKALTFILGIITTLTTITRLI